MRRRQGTKTSEAHGPAWVGHCEQGLENHGFTDITGYRDLRSQGVATGQGCKAERELMAFGEGGMGRYTEHKSPALERRWDGYFSEQVSPDGT